MSFKRKWKEGGRQRSVRRTNAGTVETFPATVIYDENADPVPFVLGLSDLRESMGQILLELKAVRRHLEIMNGETLEDDEYATDY